MGDALLWRSPAAQPLKRMPLNRVRWMDCGSDQAGAPGTTPTKTPADSGSRMHMRTGRCTLPPRSQRRLCTAARWNMAKRRPIILQTDDSGVGGLLIFPAVVLNPAAVGRRQLLSFSSLFVYGIKLGPDILAAAVCALWDYLWKIWCFTRNKKVLRRFLKTTQLYWLSGISNNKFLIFLQND